MTVLIASSDEMTLSIPVAVDSLIPKPPISLAALTSYLADASSMVYSVSVVKAANSPFFSTIYILALPVQVNLPLATLAAIGSF